MYCQVKRVFETKKFATLQQAIPQAPQMLKAYEEAYTACLPQECRKFSLMMHNAAVYNFVSSTEFK